MRRRQVLNASLKTLSSPYCVGVRRRAKTLEELRADLKAFELAYKREMACFMRNAVERMTTPGSGRRIPAKYKMKLPRLTGTVVVHGPADGASAVQPFRRRRLGPRIQKSPPTSSRDTRRLRAAENVERRQLLANAVERLRAFRNHLPMPDKLPALDDTTACEIVRSFQEAARAASQRLNRRFNG